MVQRFDERVRASVDAYLATRQHSLQSKIVALSEKVAFLEGQLATCSSGSKARSAIARKEPEF
ncbi:hypothetical protein [Aliterella atlantica]|uniref:hypothetical protein n=1 Tax=Aliterella atlantica TaxID=1827278 RepID=UPI0011858FC3|nr:hypothetical protein [Aliterella atlantica]